MNNNGGIPTKYVDSSCSATIDVGRAKDDDCAMDYIPDLIQGSTAAIDPAVVERFGFVTSMWSRLLKTVNHSGAKISRCPLSLALSKRNLPLVLELRQRLSRVHSNSKNFWSGNITGDEEGIRSFVFPPEATMAPEENHVITQL